jgi:hypothetical protein
MGKPPFAVAAEYALGNADIERVPWYAADWLADGYDGPALRELAGLNQTDPQLIRELQPIALGEMGVRIPAPAEAVQVWLTRLARRLLDGEIVERMVIEQASAFVSWNYDVDEIWDTPLADFHVLVDEWDQGWGRGNAAVAAAVRQLCVDQVRDHGDDR